jgi:hypothetical protein
MFSRASVLVLTPAIRPCEDLRPCGRGPLVETKVHARAHKSQRWWARPDNGHSLTSRASGLVVANGSVPSIRIVISRPERRSRTGTDTIWFSSSVAGGTGAAAISRIAPSHVGRIWEYRPTEISAPTRAIARSPARLSRPRRQPSSASPRETCGSRPAKVESVGDLTFRRREPDSNRQSA